MYKVVRANGQVTIYDWHEKVIFSVSNGSFILYESGLGPTTVEVDKTTDDQLLTFLAKAIKLPLEK